MAARLSAILLGVVPVLEAWPEVAMLPKVVGAAVVTGDGRADPLVNFLFFGGGTSVLC